MDIVRPHVVAPHEMPGLDEVSRTDWKPDDFDDWTRVTGDRLKDQGTLGRKTSMTEVTIVDCGAGNNQSVRNAFDMAGADPVMAATPEEILNAERLVLPGVGAAGRVMSRLRENGLDEALTEAVRKRATPTLGICIGMQIAAKTLHEYGDQDGLGWIEGDVRDLHDVEGVPGRIPHMGWNEIEPSAESAILFDAVRGRRAFTSVTLFRCAIQTREPLRRWQSTACRWWPPSWTKRFLRPSSILRKVSSRDSSLLRRFSTGCREMLHNRLIPSLLLEGGRLVKGVAYRDRRDAGNPTTTARVHNAQGADELVLMDIAASRNGVDPDFDTIAAVAEECFMPLTVGGGIASVETARRCMECGADKVCLTMTAYDNPALIGELAEILGRQAVVVGIDVLSEGEERRLYDHRRGGPADRNDWKGWMTEAVSRGAGEIRLMAVDREGRRTGMDTELLVQAESAVDVPVILEGALATSLILLPRWRKGRARLRWEPCWCSPTTTCFR